MSRTRGSKNKVPTHQLPLYVPVEQAWRMLNAVRRWRGEPVDPSYTCDIDAAEAGEAALSELLNVLQRALEIRQHELAAEALRTQALG